MLELAAAPPPPRARARAELQKECCSIDGDIDVSATQPVIGYWVLLNNGSGVFDSQELVPLAPNTGPPYMHTVTDTDGDGMRDDVFMITDGRDGSVISNGQSGSSVNWGTPLIDLSRQTISNGGNIKGADFDLDGRIDLAICELEAFQSPVPASCMDVNTFSINRNVFDASIPNQPHHYVDPFLSPQSFYVNGTWDCELADFDRDGDIDLLLTTCTGYRYFLNDLL